MSETMSETNGNKLLFCRDSEAAFGSESATRGGSFWTRIRLGKAVAGSGVRTSRLALRVFLQVIELKSSRSQCLICIVETYESLCF